MAWPFSGLLTDPSPKLDSGTMSTRDMIHILHIFHAYLVVSPCQNEKEGFKKGWWCVPGSFKEKTFKTTLKEGVFTCQLGGIFRIQSFSGPSSNYICVFHIHLLNTSELLPRSLQVLEALYVPIAVLLIPPKKLTVCRPFCVCSVWCQCFEGLIQFCPSFGSIISRQAWMLTYPNKRSNHRSTEYSIQQAWEVCLRATTTGFWTSFLHLFWICWHLDGGLRSLHFDPYSRHLHRHD